MKTLFFLSFILISNVLFAFGQRDNRSQSPVMTEQSREADATGFSDETAQDETERSPAETHIVVGGFEEVDLLSCDPDLLEFIRQLDAENENAVTGTEVIRIFRQVVRGLKYITCLKLSDGALAVFVIHKDISGEFSLLESYRDTEIFKFFGSFL